MKRLCNWSLNAAMLQGLKQHAQQVTGSCTLCLNTFCPNTVNPNLYNNWQCDLGRAKRSKIQAMVASNIEAHIDLYILILPAFISWIAITSWAKLSFIIILLFLANILIVIFVLIEIIILFAAICIIHRISSIILLISDTMLFWLDFDGIWCNIKSSNSRNVSKHILISFWYRNHEVFAPQRACRPLRVQAVD